MVSTTALVIIVNTNADGETLRLLGELVSQEGATVDAVVAHNGQQPLVVGLPGSAQSHVSVVSPPENRGYFYAADVGLDSYLTRNPMPDWVVVSNADIHIPDRGFFESLARFHGTDSPGVVAPSILSLMSRRDQNPMMRRRPSRARMRLYQLVFRFYATDAAYQFLALARDRVRRPASPQPGTGVAEPIYAPHGAFMIFNRRYFESGGSLKYGVFLYGEELFVAERARTLGLAVLYDPRLKVVHREHSETGVINQKSWRRRREASDFIARQFF